MLRVCKKHCRSKAAEAKQKELEAADRGCKGKGNSPGARRLQPTHANASILPTDAAKHDAYAGGALDVYKMYSLNCCVLLYQGDHDQKDLLPSIWKTHIC